MADKKADEQDQRESTEITPSAEGANLTAAAAGPDSGVAAVAEAAAESTDVDTLKRQIADLQARLAEHEQEPDDGKRYRCESCGAVFAGAGAKRAQRLHMESFHPSAG